MTITEFIGGGYQSMLGRAEVCETCNGFKRIYIPEFDSDTNCWIPVGSEECPDCCGEEPDMTGTNYEER